ncbi:MAG: hypothetical protein ABJE95_14275 [Byssovorax sp.]
MSQPRRARLHQSATLVLLGAMTTGCTNTTMISPLEVPRLAVTPPLLGSSDHPLHDLDGRPVTMGKRFSIRLDPRPDLPPEWGMWASAVRSIDSPIDVEVRGPMLSLRGARDLDPVEVPLAYVQRVRVIEYSHGKTAGLSIGLTLGAFTVGVLVVLIGANTLK